MRTALALLVVLLSACDPCDAAAQIHVKRCVEGDAGSCEWISQHAPSGYCI